MAVSSAVMVHVGSLIQHHINPISYLLRNIFLATLEVVDSDHVRDVDKFILTHCSSSNMGVRVPGNGFHHYNFVIFYRSTNTYTPNENSSYIIIAITKKQIKNISQKIFHQQNKYTIYIDKIESIADFQHEVHRNTIIVPPKPYLYQEKLLNEICNKFKQGRSLTVLICGQSGSGKSVMGRFLYQRFNPNFIILVEGFDVTKAGLNFNKHVLKRRDNDKMLIILVLEEIDLGMKKSFTAESFPATYIDHAKNKTTLTRFFDDLKDTPNLITLCSSNLSISDFTKEYPTYTNQHRFDIKVEFSEKDREKSEEKPQYEQSTPKPENHQGQHQEKTHQRNNHEEKPKKRSKFFSGLERLALKISESHLVKHVFLKKERASFVQLKI